MPDHFLTVFVGQECIL